jgi:hypothetical protein
VRDSRCRYALELVVVVRTLDTIDLKFEWYPWAVWEPQPGRNQWLHQSYCHRWPLQSSTFHHNSLLQLTMDMNTNVYEVSRHVFDAYISLMTVLPATPLYLL